MVVNLQSGHEIALQYNQREITPKKSKVELWCLCMTHHLIMLYNCMKFHSNNLNGCQLTERTQNINVLKIDENRCKQTEIN